MDSGSLWILSMAAILSILTALRWRRVRRAYVAQLVAAAQERVEQLNTINRITTAAGTSLELETALLALHQELTALAPVEVFFVAIYDAEADMIFYPIYIDEDKIHVYPFSDMRRRAKRRNPGFTDYIIDTARTLHVPDTLSPDANLPIPIRFGGKPARTFLGVPLLLHGQVSGVLSIQSYTPEVYSPTIIRMIETIASQVAYTIENARLFETVRQQAVEAEVLRLAAAAIVSSLRLEEIIERILDELQRVVPYETAIVQWFRGADAEVVGMRGCDGEIQLGQRHAITDQSPLIEQVLATRETQFTNNEALYQARSAPAPHGEAPASVMAIPLIAQEQIVGVMVLTKIFVWGQKWGFTQHHRQLANAFADQVSIALRNALLFEETQQLAHTDPLMGIANRRHFFAQAQAVLADGRPRKEPLAVVLIDIDHFKRVNDTYGHAAGDAVLRSVAETLASSVRSRDLIGRYGGEEIVLLMPGMPPDIAVARADLLRRRLETTPVLIGHQAITITVSIGVACADSEDTADVTIDQLLGQADQALYRCKQSGRNQVQIFAPMV